MCLVLIGIVRGPFRRASRIAYGLHFQAAEVTRSWVSSQRWELACRIGKVAHERCDDLCS